MANQQLKVGTKKPQPPKISPETWESFKDEITRLYLRERKTLDQVRVAMEEEAGFVASKAQYIRMVNDVWHLKKNLTGQDVEYIQALEKKRTRDGKKTGVKVGDRKLDEHEIRRKKSRHHVSCFEQHRRRMEEANAQTIAPHTPKEIEIFTPKSLIASPPALAASPSFQNLLLPMPAAGSPHHFPSTVDMVAASPHPSPSLEALGRLTLTSPSISPNWAALSPVLSFDLNGVIFSAPSLISSPVNLAHQPTTPNSYIGWELPELTIPSRERSPGASRLCDSISPDLREYLLPTVLYNSLLRAAPSMKFMVIFEQHMKEFFEGDISSLGSLVAGSGEDFAINEILSPKPITNPIQLLSKIHPSNGRSLNIGQVLYFLKCYMIRLSNKVDDPPTRRRCMDALLESGFIKKYISVVEMVLKQSRIRNSHNRNPSPMDDIGTNYPSEFELVVENFSVDLLYSAARVGDTYTIKLLLHIGPIIRSCPETRDCLMPKIGTTAIQYAIEYRQKASYTLLLQHNFDVNVPPVSDLSPSILWTAVMARSPQLVRDLLRKGARDTRKYFDFRNGNYLEYRRELHNKDTIWETSHDYNDTIKVFKIKTALQLSVATRELDCALELIPAASDRPELLRPDELSGLLMFAAHNRDYRMIGELAQQPLWQGQITRQHQGDPALTIAIIQQDIPCIETLIGHGADPQNVDISQFGTSVSLGLGPVSSSFGEYLSQPRNENLASIIRQQIHRVGFNMPTTYRSREAEYPTTIFSNTVPLRMSGDLPLSVIIANLDTLAQGYSSDRLGLLRSFIIFISSFLGPTWQGSLEVALNTKSTPSNPTGCIELSTFAFNRNQAIIPRNGPEAKRLLDHSRFNPIKRLFREAWPVCSSFWVYTAGDTMHVNWKLPLPPKITETEVGNLVIQLRMLWASETTSGSSPKQYPTNPLDYKPKKHNPLDLPRFRYEQLLFNIPANPSAFVASLVQPNSKTQSHKEICAGFIDVIPDLTELQLQSLLQLAIYADVYEIVESIIEFKPMIKINQEAFRQAAWFAGPKIFDLILGQYWRTSGGEDDTNFEFLLLIAISTGDLYKVINLLPFTNVDHDYGLERTPLGVAVFLGKLDICKVLLESGACKYLSNYQKEAYDKGHLAIESLIRKARDQIPNDHDSLP